MQTSLERFLRYVTIETTSAEGVEMVPSTPGQFDLARLLVEELKELGLDDAQVDEHCYVMATLPSNLPPSTSKQPVLGLLAHLDTSDAASGKNVQATVFEYQGGDIVLKGKGIIPEDERLRRCRGHQIVVTDGTTLLGGDDKAGIAAIMTMLERLIAENRSHGTIRVCFTPDEEVGNGTAWLDLKKFGADIAYTVDCGPFGEINKETFNADKAVLTIQGKDIHPGYAKGVMVNAARVLTEIIATLPSNRTPETTAERQPFIHLLHLEGNVTAANAHFILRAFTEEEQKKNIALLENAFEQVTKQHAITGQLTIERQYRNMGLFLEKTPEVTQKLEQAVRQVGVEPRWVPVRGGTDGARLSEMGLPTPNVFAGYYNHHSLHEWLSVDDLNKSVEVLLKLVELWKES